VLHDEANFGIGTLAGLAILLLRDNSGGIVRFRGLFGTAARLSLAALEVFSQCGLKPPRARFLFTQLWPIRHNG
jgi:hypothetical protein